MRGNRKAQNSEPAKEKLHIGIFAGIAVLAFLLTAVFYGIGFFPFQPTHSDGNGYYMYLPAFFVYHDPGMHFLDQLAEDISGFSGTFFPMDTGQVVDKYTMGVAILQLPFFLAADILTKLFRPEAADGFAAQVLELMLFYPQPADQHTAFSLLAFEGYAVPLVPHLAEKRRAEVAERYRKRNPPRRMLPNQKKLWRALTRH